MIDLTISVDENSLALARNAALQMGTNLNQLLREQVDQLAGLKLCEAEALAYLASVGKGKSGGWLFNREEIQRGL